MAATTTRNNGGSCSRRAALAALVCLVVAAAPTGVAHACAPVPLDPARPLPADGAVGVPTDARILGRFSGDYVDAPFPDGERGRDGASGYIFEVVSGDGSVVEGAREAWCTDTTQRQISRGLRCYISFQPAAPLTADTGYTIRTGLFERRPLVDPVEGGEGEGDGEEWVEESRFARGV